MKEPPAVVQLDDAGCNEEFATEKVKSIDVHQVDEDGADEDGKEIGPSLHQLNEDGLYDVGPLDGLSSDESDIEEESQF